jgi:hypothetical protein
MDCRWAKPLLRPCPTFPRSTGVYASLRVLLLHVIVDDVRVRRAFRHVIRSYRSDADKKQEMH